MSFLPPNPGPEERKAAWRYNPGPPFIAASIAATVYRAGAVVGEEETFMGIYLGTPGGYNRVFHPPKYPLTSASLITTTLIPVAHELGDWQLFRALLAVDQYLLARGAVAIQITDQETDQVSAVLRGREPEMTDGWRGTGRWVPWHVTFRCTGGAREAVL